jgi:DNA-binding response OmpR family regulator
MKPNLHVLIVEDEDISASLVEYILTENNYRVTIAADGETAWSLLTGGASFDAVLLDLGLPDIDGTIVLQRMMADPELRSVPVIILSWQDDIKNVSKIMAAGAKYYLTKPPEVPYLLAVVRSAVEMSREVKGVRESLDEALRYIGLLKTGTFNYSTVAEASGLAKTLAQECAEPLRAWQGLQELFINAVEHGNLGISYEEKSLLLLENRFGEEIERREQDPKYSSLQVCVRLVRTSDKLELTIQDQGNGFVWQEYLEYSEARAFDLHGRGIALATYCFDSIEYSGNGNTVKVTISGSPTIN